MSERLFSVLARSIFAQDLIKAWAIVLLLIGLGMADCGVKAAIYDRSGRKIPDVDVNSDEVNWQILSSSRGKKYNGVGLVDLRFGVCTGFLITTGARNPTAPAYVITNGHCQGGSSGLPKPQDILVNQPSQTNFIVNYFHDFKSVRLSLPVRRMVYGTMKNNDIAILELATTQQQVLKAGIIPLRISAKPAVSGEPIIVVGIPSQGVNDPLNFLHLASCQAGETIHLKEGVYDWNRSVRHRCSIVGGMSGSPMISRTTNQVIGIVNTGVDDTAAGLPECSLNLPCEILRNGKIQTFPEQNYGQLIDRIPACFDLRGIFNLHQSSSCGSGKCGNSKISNQWNCN